MKLYFNQSFISRRNFQIMNFVLICFSVGLLTLGFDIQAQPKPEFKRAIIYPTLIELNPLEKQNFSVTMLPTRLQHSYIPDDVKWYVNDIPGGNDTYGIIDQDGNYTAPAVVPSPPEINIVARVEKATNKYLWATVLLGEPAYTLVDEFSESGDNREYFVSTHSVTLDIDGNLLITDEESDRVFRMTTDGEYLGDVGSYADHRANFIIPRIAVSDTSGNTFVLDEKADSRRIQVFSAEEKLINEFGEKGTGSGHILRGHGLVINSDQNIFVTDIDNMRVNAYSSDGRFLYDFGKDGLEPQNFNAPHGLDRKSTRLNSSHYS